MSTLTLRIDAGLKAKAAKQASKIGIPLTYIVKNALINFVKSPTVVIGEPEVVIVDQRLQKKMDNIGTLLS